MQLLKLLHHRRPKLIPTTHKQNHQKNYYFTILQKCIHIPKDDRLILRKYLCTLKQLNQHDQIITLLLKYTSKANKQNNNDHKIQVLLRKQADRIKKKYLQEITSFQKPTLLNSHSNKSITIDPHKYQNYQALKQIIKMPISTSTTSKQSQSPSNSKVNSIPSSRNQVKLNQINCTSHHTKYKKYQNYKFPSLKCSPRSVEFPHIRKNLRSSKQPSISTQRFKQKYLKIPQINNFIPIQSKSVTLKKFPTNFKIKSSQTTKNYNNNPNIIFPNKHKHTLSKSMVKLSTNNYQQKSPQKNCLTFREIDKDAVSSYRSEEITSKITDVSMIEKSGENSNNSSIYNFNTFNCHRQANFQLCHEYLMTKSVHSDLKSLKIPSEQLFDFLLPHTLRSSRAPSDLSLPYIDFITKINQYIKYNYSSLTDYFCSPHTVYIPFHTQYDLVTFDKFIKFIEEYTFPQYQNNQVRNVFTRIKIVLYGTSHINLQRKKINIQQFANIQNYKKLSLKSLFQQLIKKCNRWGTSITYWQLYWLKYTQQFKIFQKQFNFD